MNIIIKVLPIILAAIAMQPYAQAAEPAAAKPATTATATPTVDEVAQVDEGLKRFGYLAGLARGCVVEAQHTPLDREALDLNNAIGRLLGTDRAFLFTSSFGYGTSVQTETKDCADVLKAYESRVEKFRAGRGGAQ
jgi:hypothetical protein